MKQFSLDIAGKTFTFTFNDLASQADGSVLAQCGETIVLATVLQEQRVKGGASFFPFMVNYDERFYATGKILGSRFVRREGRPTDEAVLTGRMIDRSLRPLFAKNERRDTQVTTTILSFDRENDPDVLSLFAASLALGVSDIAFDGPLGAIRLGRIGGKFVVNPTYKEREARDVDFVVAGKRDLVTMIDGEAKEISEEDGVSLIKEAFAWFEKIIAFQETIIKEQGKQKRAPLPVLENSSLARMVKDFCRDNVSKAFKQKSDKDAKEALRTLRGVFQDHVAKEMGAEHLGPAFDRFDEEIEHSLQELILKEGRRPDGRAVDELRPLSAEVGIFKRTHGSSLFQRGLTHALSIVTLGAPGDERLMEGMEAEEKQRFMHHYNFPSFSVGEVSPPRAPSRRELGHGYLAQKAVEGMLPPVEEFPYTIRTVTEILSSNGSTSMASACGMSMALMDAGVPMKKPVAGVAMGLVYESNNRFAVLTDIQGPEDQEGQMDCKVAGTRDGITAIQLDTKLQGLPLAIMEKTFHDARVARLKILEVMEKAIARPRVQLSPFAPRLLVITVDPSKIRFIIGPGGETINGIVAKTGAKIDIEDDGMVFITAQDSEGANEAKAIIESITRDIKPGDVIKGKVSGIMDFGAFVQLTPAKDGLVHISELGEGYVKSAGDIVKLGQEVEVTVLDIDPQGKVRLSMRKGAFPSKRQEQRRR